MSDQPPPPNVELAKVLDGLRIEEPISHGPLHVFPLRNSRRAKEGLFLLLEDGLEVGTLRVEELNEAGSVPELRVVNEGSLPVLILEGDELVGAKQNRVVNSSVLVAAYSDLTLPVSCVERGRWSYRSRGFSPGAGSPHIAIRRLTARSVHESLRRGRGHRSDQRAVWERGGPQGTPPRGRLTDPRAPGLAVQPLGEAGSLRGARR